MQDVFSRKIDTEAIDDKKAATINEAFKKMVDTPVDGQAIKVTIDKGLEFSSLDELKGIVHSAKEPSDKNAIAVIDRSIQTIKKDISADIIDEGGRWNEKVDAVTFAYNDRPNSHTIVSPNEVETNGVAQFKLLQHKCG